MIISLTNQKGGVGKSTTAQALAAGLTLKGFKTLLIDLDPQCNITYSTRTESTKTTAYELLTGKAKAEEVVKNTPQGDIIPASKNLTRLDIELNETGKEYKLKEALTPIKNRYNFIIIDTPPSLGILTVNALTASDAVIIPAQADIYSLQGIGQLTETVEAIKKYCNPALKIIGILLTRHNPRSILSKDMAELIDDAAAQIGTTAFKTVIREGIAIKEAQASRQDLFTYAAKSKAAADYLAFTEEVIERGGNNVKEKL